MSGIKKYQIFISSTYEDLKEEREIVEQAVLSEYNIPVGMEFFCASTNEQWDIIQETIDTSDYYVLIVGRSYGTIIESGSDKGISYTEKEFKYAVENNIPVLAFILKDGALPKKKYDDEQIKRDGLEKFKALIKKNRMVDFWKNGDELARKVNTAIANAINRNPRLGWIRGEAIISAYGLSKNDMDNNRLLTERGNGGDKNQQVIEKGCRGQDKVEPPVHLEISKIDPTVISKKQKFVDALRSLNGGFTVADISKVTGMSMQTVLHKIRQMVDDGDVEKYGAGRKTQFYYIGAVDYSDGLHIIYDDKGIVLKEGEWKDGNLYKGIEYDCLIKDVNGALVYNPVTNDYDGEYNTEIEEIMPLRDKKYKLKWVFMDIAEDGLDNYYVCDVLVDNGSTNGVKCEYAHIKKFEKWLEENDQNALKSLKEQIQLYHNDELKQLVDSCGDLSD